MRSAFETDLAEVCAPRQCNVGLLAYSPLAGGALSGKYIAGGKGHEKSRFNIFPGYMERCAACACAAATLVLLQASKCTCVPSLPAETLSCGAKAACCLHPPGHPGTCMQGKRMHACA